jgi:hypothetical protein
MQTSQGRPSPLISVDGVALISGFRASVVIVAQDIELEGKEEIKA